MNSLDESLLLQAIVSTEGDEIKNEVMRKRKRIRRIEEQKNTRIEEYKNRRTKEQKNKNKKIVDHT